MYFLVESYDGCYFYSWMCFFSFFLKLLFSLKASCVFLQLADIIGELHRLLAKRRSGHQPQKEHPALHPQFEEETQEEENQVLSGV